MICAQLEAAKVSRRHAQTTSLSFPAFSPSTFWGGFFTPAKPLQRPPSQKPGSTLLPTLSSARFNCWLGAGRRPSRAGIPRLGYSRLIRPSQGPRRETKKPPNGFAAPPPPLGALPVARRWQRRGRRDLRNPPSQPTPTPCELRLLDNCIPWFPLELCAHSKAPAAGGQVQSTEW